jgi:hypothetical protein
MSSGGRKSGRSPERAIPLSTSYCDGDGLLIAHLNVVATRDSNSHYGDDDDDDDDDEDDDNDDDDDDDDDEDDDDDDHDDDDNDDDLSWERAIWWRENVIECSSPSLLASRSSALPLTCYLSAFLPLCPSA